MREKLNEDFCERVTRPGYHADGGGLYLNVKANGRKYWCFRWRDRHQRYPTGKSAGMGRLREKGLGRAGKHDVSLDEARRLAGECRKLVRMGLDPISGENWNSSVSAAGGGFALSFGDCAVACIETLKPRWQSPAQAAKWASSLNRHAAPLMRLPVAAVNEKTVVASLQPLWLEKTETAMRVRQRIEAVLDWAIEHGHHHGPNPARWRGNLDQALPRPAQIRGAGRKEAIPYTLIPGIYQKLGLRPALAARALQLQVLTASRPREMVAARWEEFRLKGAVWVIPAQRSGGKADRTVPLSPDALRILGSLPRTSGFLFPGRDSGRCMSTAAGMKLLRAVAPGATQLALRNAFREWAQTETPYSSEVIECAMGPKAGWAPQPANLRSDLIAGTTRLINEWARYCLD